MPREFNNPIAYEYIIIASGTPTKPVTDNTVLINSACTSDVRDDP